jgi:hypothetical protein
VPGTAFYADTPFEVFLNHVFGDGSSPSPCHTGQVTTIFGMEFAKKDGQTNKIWTFATPIGRYITLESAVWKKKASFLTHALVTISEILSRHGNPLEGLV